MTPVRTLRQSALCLAMMLVGKAYAQSLYVCPEDGVDNIVSKPTGEHCRPYQKGMFGSGTASVESLPTNAQGAVRPARPAAKSETSQAAAPPTTEQSALAEALRGMDNLPADMPAPTRISTPETRAAARAEEERLAAEQQALAEAKKAAQAAQKPEPKKGFFQLKDVPAEVSVTEIERLTQEKIDAEEAAYRKANPYSTQSIYYKSPFKEKVPIWNCPDGKGGVMVIDSADQPLDECSIAGETGSLGDKQSASVDFHRGKTGRAALKNQDETAPPPVVKDIYKCFDGGGEPVYVNEDLREGYRNCTFWSRSFANVRQQFQKEASTQKPLEQLAQQGVQDQSALAVAKSAEASGRLHCTGAGYIEFNGRVEQYHCANRSYDLTPGTSGGSARLGERQVEIAAHRLDYLNTHGSCGGTITAENGRILHLEPTKDCPEAVIIEARRIEAEYKQALNINVSGAFKERQRQLRDQINRIAHEIGVDVYLVHAVISAESAYKPNAKSHAGAMGLMQLMPATAKRFGVTEPYNTEQNVRGGTTYLKWLLKEFNGNMELAAAGYNAGEGNVRKYGYKIPPFIETRAYVPKVMEYYRRYKANPSEIGL